MNTYTMHRASVLDWAAAYTGPKYHAMFCDPPYHMTEMTKRFGKPGSAPAQYGTDGAFARQALVRPLQSLYFSIRAPVARIAERDEVGNVVRFLVALQTKQAERLLVVNIGSGRAALLACVVVPTQRLAPLRLPVRAAIISKAKILRVIQSVTMSVTTWARTVFTAAFSLIKPALIHHKRLIAIKAYQFNFYGFRGARFNRSILTRGRTVLTAPVFQSRWYNFELVTAILTR